MKIARLLSYVLSLVISSQVAFAQDNSEIEIGFVVPTSGEEVTEGAYQLKSAQLAVKLANAAGGINGRKLKLIVADNKSTPPGSVEAFNSLASSNKMMGILTPIKSPQMLAIAPAMKKSGIPVLSASSLSRLTEDNQWFFRVRPPESVPVAGTVTFIKYNLKATRVAVYHDDNAFGVNSANFFAEHAKKENLQIVKRAAFGKDTTDFKPALQDFKNLNVEVMVVFGNNGRKLAQLIQQYTAFGQPFKYIGNTTSAQEGTLALAKEAANGIYAMADSVPYENETNKKFQDAYRAEFNNETPDTTMCWPFDAVNLLVNSMKKSGVNRGKIREGMIATKGFEGVLGTYNYNEKGEGLNDIAIVRVEGGRPKLQARMGGK